MDSPEAEGERLSQSHVLYLVIDTANSPGLSSDSQGGASALLVEKKVGTHDMQSVFLANDRHLLESGGGAGEDFNVCPRQIPVTGQLNILREEEEEEDVDDDEESETEFWFERSVNEKDEERFTLKADELAQNHSEKNLINSGGEKVEHTDSDKDLRVMCSSYTSTSSIQIDSNSVSLSKSECDKINGGPERNMTTGNHLGEEVGEGVDVRCRRNHSCRDHCLKCSNSFDAKQSCPLCSLLQNPVNEMHVSVASFVSRAQVHIDVDVEKGSAGLCDEEGMYRVADIPTCEVLLCPGEAKQLLVYPSSVVGIRDLGTGFDRCIPSNITSASRSAPVSSSNHEISSESDHRSDLVEQIYGDDFIAELGPCDRKCTKNTEAENSVQKNVAYQDFQNEGELYTDLDLDLENLIFPLACLSSDLNLSDFGLAPDQASCQGDGVDDLGSLRRKTSGALHNCTSVKCDGIDNPAFFCDDVPEESVDEDSINRRFFGSCDADSAVCYLNSDLPSVTIEECISDNDVSDDSFEGGVCNVYEEMKHLTVINARNMGETDTVWGQINDVKGRNDFFGEPSDENRGVGSDAKHADVINGCRDASANIDDLVTEGVNQSPRLTLKCTDDLSLIYTDVDTSTVDARFKSNLSETNSSSARFPRPQEGFNGICQMEPEPISEEVRNILISPQPFIAAFEQEIRLIYSKRENASASFVTDTGSNLFEGNNSIGDIGLENGFVVSDAHIDDKVVDDSFRYRSEKKDSSMSKKVLVNDVIGECTRSTVSSLKEKAEASTLLQMSESECFVYSDELYTECVIYRDDDEGLYLNLPLAAVNDMEKDTGAVANEIILTNAGQKVRNTSSVSVSRKGENATQMDTGSTVTDADETHAQVNIVRTHNDTAVFKNASGLKLCGKSKDLLPKKFMKYVHSATPDLKVMQEAIMPNVTNRSPLLARDGLVSCSEGTVVPDASGRTLVNVEAETLLESAEFNIDKEIRDRPAAVIPESSSSCTQSSVVPQVRLPGSVARNVCLRLEPGHALSRGLQPSDLSITSKVVLDDENETVVCSNSFCSEGAQATVTSTVNLLVPSLEVDIAIQKQNLEFVDGTLELGQASSERVRGGDELPSQRPQINQIVPTISGHDVREQESSSQVMFRVAHQISYNDMLTCALNFVDVFFWICLAVAIIVFDFRNWTT